MDALTPLSERVRFPVTHSGAPSPTLLAIRAAVAVACVARAMVRDARHECHDLPGDALDAARRYFADPSDDALAAAARGYYGEAMAAELRRKGAIEGAAPESVAAVVALLDAARVALSVATWWHGWFEQPGMAAAAFVPRTVVGAAAYALVAIGWTHENAWRETLELYAGHGGGSEL